MGEGKALLTDTDVAESIGRIHLEGVEIGRVLHGLESKLAELLRGRRGERQRRRGGGTTSNL